ncbi:hypothetical protein F441_07473, partial [Phytophthora nicotianae CJ01A1]
GRCHHEQVLSSAAKCTRGVDAYSRWQLLQNPHLKKDALIRAGNLPRCLPCSAEAFQMSL